MQDLPKKSAAADSNPESIEDRLRGQRLELIQKFQEEALERQNPLAANLAVINGDLMTMAFRLKQSIEKTSVKSDSASFRQIAQQTEAYLKCVRQIDRFAQIDRLLSKHTEPELPE